MRLRFGLVLLSSLLVLPLACGGGDSGDSDASAGVGEPADAVDSDRSVEVEALDTLRFDPSDLEVSVGETITFSVTNAGDLEHEFVIGSEEDSMAAHQGSMGHGEGSLVLDGGAEDEVTWTFTEAGELDYACYIDGHNEAGMMGTILITE